MPHQHSITVQRAQRDVLDTLRRMEAIQIHLDRLMAKLSIERVTEAEVDAAWSRAWPSQPSSATAPARQASWTSAPYRT